MGFLAKLFGGKKQEDTAVAEAPPLECPHSVLVPRWETVQDMGIEEKASRYMCEACHEEFTPEKARELRDSTGDRLTAVFSENAGESGERSNT